MKTVNVNKLSPGVCASIRAYQSENKGTIQGDVLSVKTAIQYYLEWEGVFGYASPIMDIIDHMWTNNPRSK